MGKIARDAVATWIVATVGVLVAITFGGPLLLKGLGALFAALNAMHGG